MKPPQNIPNNLLSEFTLNNKIPVNYWYFNDSDASNTILWDNNLLESFIKRFTFENILNNTFGYEQYPGAALYHVMTCYKYNNNIKNKNIAVIGSQYPWIEAILVNAGAKSVTTVEYNVPICNHNIIKAISYDTFCNSNEKYDAIFSYSSIEHSGLGRYGDPLNPNGDIETMGFIYKALIDNGYCFLGIPIGKDCLVWNAHRIYGKERLELLYLNNFKEIEWIGHSKESLLLDKKANNGTPEYNIQPIIVLQK
jgi:hypothetical protein